MKLVIILFCVVCILINTNASRILVWIPTPSISHQVVYRSLSQELAKRGHEVVAITTDPVFPKGEAPTNLTEIDVHDISYTLFRKTMLELPKGNANDLIGTIEPIFLSIIDLIDAQLNNTAVKEVLFGEKSFDLLILEALARPTLALTHIIKAPVIQVSTLGPFFLNLDVIGAPSHPLLYPTCIRQKLANLSMWDKIMELYNHFSMVKIINKLETNEEDMLRKHFGDNLPPLSELANNVDMLFLNMHPIFEGNHPVPPGVIYTWGIYKKPQKALPQELKTFLDNSKQGVIYMSFGSNTDPTRLPAETIKIFMKVFCQLPYDVLFKWDADDLPGRCENIRIGKWFPQSDLLRHPSIKLFITQGGLQSTDEAITAGVPLVGIPMLGDQWYNVEKYVHFKIGVRLDADTLTEEQFKNAINTVIDDESYRRNIKKLDELLRDEPLSGLQRAVWWSEHALRHGGARHLRAPAANISWADYLELRLMAVLFGGLFAALLVILATIYSLFKFLSRLRIKSKVE